MKLVGVRQVDADDRVRWRQRIDVVTREGNISPFYLHSKKDLTESNGVLEEYKSPVTTAFRNKSRVSKRAK